jgi:hypothetical protein
MIRFLALSLSLLNEDEYYSEIAVELIHRNLETYLVAFLAFGEERVARPETWDVKMYDISLLRYLLNCSRGLRGTVRPSYPGRPVDERFLPSICHYGIGTLDSGEMEEALRQSPLWDPLDSNAYRSAEIKRTLIDVKIILY